MRKYVTIKMVVLYSTLLFVFRLYGNSLIVRDNPSPYEASFTVEPTALTPTPVPKIPTKNDPSILFVRNTILQMGDSTDDVLRKLGYPGRIAETEYDFTYYIYNNDYKRLLFVALKDNEVVGYYTDSLDFEYLGFRYGSSLEAVNSALRETLPLSPVLTKHVSDYKVSILMDQLETESAVGVYVLTNTVMEEGYQEKHFSQIEQMIYDLTNSTRVRNGLDPLSWSSSAGLAARKHSINMAAKDFFRHTDPSFRSPGDRLNAEGIAYKKCGENIIAGYGSAILSSHGWFNSEKHRRNLLNKHFRYLGVGFTYDEDSIYKTYITQNFYR